MIRAKSGHSMALSASMLVLITGGAAAQQPDLAAAEALKQCDRVASHPHDPGGLSPGVTDEQLAAGMTEAVPVCEKALQLNPDTARAWFELGRAYWSSRRDGLGVKAFIEAANRNYAPAMKYLGDAYLEGRGLAAGQVQDATAAMAWYRKSASGGFTDAEATLREAANRQKEGAMGLSGILCEGSQ